MKSIRIEEINLRRAQSALGCARAAQGPELRGDYLKAVEAFPFSARSLGFGQALALLRAGGAKDPGKLQLYRDLQTWLCDQQEHSPYHGEGKNDLLAALTGGDQRDYRAALIETEAYLAWLKPFAQALLSQPDKPQSAADAAATL